MLTLATYLNFYLSTVMNIRFFITALSFTSLLMSTPAVQGSPLFSGKTLISQTKLLPPPPSSPNPVPDPNTLSFTPNATSYRVMAAVTSTVEEQQVKAAYPGAFFTNFNGQRLLQVGSFSDPLNAQQAALSFTKFGTWKLLLIPNWEFAVNYVPINNCWG